MAGARNSLENLVGLAYDAVAGADGWHPFLARLRDATGADRAALLARGSSLIHLSEICSAPFGSSGACPRCGGPPWPAPSSKSRVGSLRLSRQQAAGLELQTLTVAVCDSCTKGCTIGLARAAEPFSPNVRDLLLEIVPHVGRVLSIRKSVDASRCLYHAAVATMNRLPYGVLLLDESGGVILANEAARSMLGRFDGLRIDHDRLVASDRRQHAELRARLGDAATRVPGAGENQWTMTVTDRAGESTLLVRLFAFGPSPDLFDREPHVVVFLIDPQRTPAVDQGLLARAYELTPAEARLAAEIAAGGTMEAVADRLDVSMPTLRTHLHRIFSKTGTSRQADLMRLLLLGFIEYPSSI